MHATSTDCSLNYYVSAAGTSAEGAVRLVHGCLPKPAILAADAMLAWAAPMRLATLLFDEKSGVICFPAAIRCQAPAGFRSLWHSS